MESAISGILTLAVFVILAVAGWREIGLTDWDEYGGGEFNTRDSQGTGGNGQGTRCRTCGRVTSLAILLAILPSALIGCNAPLAPDDTADGNTVPAEELGHCVTTFNPFNGTATAVVCWEPV